MFYVHTTHPSPSSLQLGSKKKLVLTQLAPQRHEMFSRIKESLSQISEISNVVKKNAAKDRKGKRLVKSPRYLVCRHLLNCTLYVLSVFHLLFFIVSLPTC